MNMTLEQVRNEMQVLYGTEVTTAHLDRWSDAIDAHLTRKPEVSEEDVERAHKAYWDTPDDHKGDDRHAMRAALTTVWHNRPAQEKAEPVAWPPRALVGKDGVSLQSGYEFLPLDEKEAAVWNRCLDECQKATAPPAERVSVPDGWKLVPIEPSSAMVELICKEHTSSCVWPDDFDSKAQRIRREAAARGYLAALSAAPEAEHD